MSKRTSRWHAFEANPHGPGWYLTIRPPRRGGGYRAIDFPWHRPSIHAPKWRRDPWLSYIPGFTVTVGTRLRNIQTRKPARWLHVDVRRNGNGGVCPRWWSGG